MTWRVAKNYCKRSSDVYIHYDINEVTVLEYIIFIHSSTRANVLSLPCLWTIILSLNPIVIILEAWAFDVLTTDYDGAEYG